MLRPIVPVADHAPTVGAQASGYGSRHRGAAHVHWTVHIHVGWDAGLLDDNAVVDKSRGLW